MIRHFLVVAARNSRKHPGYALIHLFGLACGFAAALLIFQFIQNELSYDRFHSRADYIAGTIAYRDHGDGQLLPIVHMPLPLGPAIVEENPAARNFVRISGADQVHVIAGNVQAVEYITFADPALFTIFNFPLLEGTTDRLFASPTEVVLTESYARKYFGRLDVIGESLVMFFYGERRSFTIAAVAADVPATSTIQFTIVVPMTAVFRFEQASTRWNWWRVRTFVEFDRPLAELDTTRLTGIIERHWTDRQSASPMPLSLRPLKELHLDPAAGGTDPRSSYILGAIALAILLIAGINYVTLGIARGAARGREVAVRKLFGAARRQLLGQFLAESLLLALAALILGAALAEVSLPAFGEFVGRTLQSSGHSTSLLIVFGLAIALFTGLGAGLAPALLLSRPQPAAMFRRAVTVARSGIVMRGMIVVQLGLSLFLVAATIVMHQQSRHLSSRPLGYSPQAVMVVQRPPDNSISDIDFLQRLRHELSGAPGIVSISATSASFNRGYDATGWTSDNKHFTAYLYRVDPAYISTLNMTLVAGRDFAADPAADVANPIIVNESLLKELGPRYSVGSTIPALDTTFEQFGTPTIVGVVKDYHFLSLHEQIGPAVLFTKELYPYFQLLVRIDESNISVATAAVERAYEKATNGLKCEWSFLEDDLAQQYQAERRWSRIITSSAVFAVGIAALGIFGLAGITAVRRSREVGIRKVLGASIPQVLATINREYVILVLVANLIVLPLAWYAARRWLENFAYHIDLSAGSFLLAAALTSAVALTAVSMHTLRAVLDSPAKVLRQD